MSEGRQGDADELVQLRPEAETRAIAIEAQAGQIATLVDRAGETLAQVAEMVRHRRTMVDAGQDPSAVMRCLPVLLGAMRDQLIDIGGINAGQGVYG